MSANSNFAAALLAGGQSSRMGFDKALALFEGEPLWQRQLATLRTLGAIEIFISGKTDRPYAEAGCGVVTDDSPGMGPLGGFEALLRRTTCEWLVVLGIDLPRMHASYLRGLIEKARNCRTGVVPTGAHGYEPFAAIYPRELRELAEECLRSADHSMQNLLRKAERLGFIVPCPIEIQDEPLFLNINSARDLA